MNKIKLLNTFKQIKKYINDLRMENELQKKDLKKSSKTIENLRDGLADCEDRRDDYQIALEKKQDELSTVINILQKIVEHVEYNITDWRNLETKEDLVRSLKVEILDLWEIS